MTQPLLPTSPVALKSHGNTVEFPGISVVAKDQEMEILMDRIVQHNDYPAFQILFKKMYAPLCQFCMKFVKAREVAEELVSDVFYNIWKNRSRLIIASPKAYLFASVRNKGYDHLRKIRNTTWCDLEEATNVPAGMADSQDMLVYEELNTTLEQSMARLPKQCRLIFALSREEGLKYREIAALLNLSVKTVETQMGRALKHLRSALPPL
ncbi:MAG TPA: RNA polymerase sigma-70 factor [Chryseolinea sp.]